MLSYTEVDHYSVYSVGSPLAFLTTCCTDILNRAARPVLNHGPCPNPLLWLHNHWLASVYLGFIPCEKLKMKKWKWEESHSVTMTYIDFNRLTIYDSGQEFQAGNHKWQDEQINWNATLVKWGLRQALMQILLGQVRGVVYAIVPFMLHDGDVIIWQCWPNPFRCILQWESSFKSSSLLSPFSRSAPPRAFAPPLQNRDWTLTHSFLRIFSLHNNKHQGLWAFGLLYALHIDSDNPECNVGLA